MSTASPYVDMRKEWRESLKEKEKPWAMSTRDKGSAQRSNRMMDRKTVEEEDLTIGKWGF